MSDKRGIELQGRAREIVFNVYKYFESEKVHANELLQQMSCSKDDPLSEDTFRIPVELFVRLQDYLKNSMKVTKRVGLSTGVNKNTITRIKRLGIHAEKTGGKIVTPMRKPRGKSIELDKYGIKALRQKIKDFYSVHKEVPTLNQIYLKAKDDLNFEGSKTSLWRVLRRQLGYRFKSCDKKKSSRIVQRSNKNAWRSKYLRHIRESDTYDDDSDYILIVA